jgi:hypothetical protein
MGERKMFTPRYLSVVMVVALVAGLSQGTALADTVAFWQFNNSLSDSSGNSHDGYATSDPPGAAYVTDGGTVALQQANGTSDITIPGSSAFQLSGSVGYTVEARVKYDTSTPAYKMLIDCTASGGGPGWWLRTTNGGLLQSDAYDGAGEQEAIGTTNLYDGAWHHVAAVFNGSANLLSLYVDYQAEGSLDYNNSVALTSLIGTDTNFRIGVNHTNGQAMYGDIDYIRVSNVALAPAEFVGYGVPEPSTMIMLIVGGLGLLCYAWRKRK